MNAVLPDIVRAIEYGRTIIPTYVNDPTLLDSSISDANEEQWSGIFEKERFTPALAGISQWKATHVILEQVKELVIISNHS